jgi:hypothetical protein
MARIDLEPGESLRLLRDLPRQIADLTAGLTESEATAPPAPGEWSVVEIIAHLRSCADVWGDAIAVTLAEDEPTIRAIDPRTWVERTDYRELPLAETMAAFLAQREALLATLEPLTPAQWERAATSVGAGRPLTRTVRHYADRLAGHERTHIRPLRKTIAAVRTI